MVDASSTINRRVLGNSAQIPQNHSRGVIFAKWKPGGCVAPAPPLEPNATKGAKKEMLRKAVLAASFLAIASLPASAGSITIDSDNCNNSNGDCFGLSWTLDVNLVSGSLYQAILTVEDDPDADPDSGQLISAVSFKASSSVTGATLVSAPNDPDPVTTWTTFYNTNLSSGGCSGNGGGMVCSQSSTNPVSFTGTDLIWVWTFTTTQTGIAETGDELKIGAKLTTLDQSGKLLSVKAKVPEPTSLSLLGVGLLALLGVHRRQR
jgi:hypothetical protein